VAVVSLNAHSHPRYLEFTSLARFTSQAVKQRTGTHLTPGRCVSRDGLGCVAAVAKVGCVRMPTVVGRAKPRDLPELQWVNTISFGPNHAGRFLRGGCTS
jgi:hypothetical protein